MKIDRLIVVLLVVVPSVLITDVSFAVSPKIGNEATQTTGPDESIGNSVRDMFQGMVPEKPRYQNGPQSLSKESLRVEVPQITLSIFDKQYSVGGHCVRLPVKLVPDDFIKSYSTRAQWSVTENVFRMRASDYHQICQANETCRRNGHYQGMQIESDEEFWKILHHEALHADFVDKYRSLIKKI